MINCKCIIKDKHRYPACPWCRTKNDTTILVGHPSDMVAYLMFIKCNYDLDHNQYKALNEIIEKAKKRTKELNEEEERIKQKLKELNEKD